MVLDSAMKKAGSHYKELQVFRQKARKQQITKTYLLASNVLVGAQD